MNRNAHSAAPGRRTRNTPRVCRLRCFLLAIMSAVAVGCSDGAEPLPPDVWLATSTTYVDVFVDDSVLVHAQVRDGFDRLLPIDLTVNSADPGIVSVTTDVNQLPDTLPEERFWLRAIGFGRTQVNVAHQGLNLNIAVNTWPADVIILGVLDTMLSGTSVQLSALARGAAGTALPDVPIDEIESDMGLVDADGLFHAQDPGFTRIEARALDARGDTTTFVVPAPFNGSLSPALLAGCDRLGIRHPPGAPWTGDERLYIDGESRGSPPVGADTAFAIVPGIVGSYELEIRRLGPLDYTGVDTIAVVSDYVVHDTPATAPDITAGPFPYSCQAPMSAASPTDLRILQPTTSTTYRFEVDWNTPAAATDIDVYFVDCTTLGFISCGGGCGASKPERATATIPGGACWIVWLDHYSGDPAVVDILIDTW